MTSPDTDLVLAQDAWLRRLARRLVQDPGLADDLAQEAWVAGLERGRTDLGARAWLAGVLRNRGRATFRADARRRAREQSSAAREDSEATDEVVAQLQLRRNALDEMLALEEPFRTALYLTFVENATVREVARRTDVPRSTASDRIQKGLVRLRERLDRAYGGERRTWLSALVPLARPHGAAGLLAGGLPASVVAGSLVLVAAVVLVVPARSRSTGAPEAPTGTLARVDARSGGTATEVELLAEDPTASTPATARSPVAVAAEPPVAAAPSAGDPESGVTGVFLLPGGAPAAGARWTLHGSRGNQDRVIDHGVPEDWTDPTGTTDDAGLLDHRFDPPRAFQFRLTVEHGDCVRERFRWGILPTDRVEDLGTITMREGGSVAGRILGSSNAPLTGTAWSVRAEEVHGGSVTLRRPASDSAKADEDTAEFRIDRLPAGTVALHVFDERFGRSRKQFVTITPGETLLHDIVLEEAEPFANAVTVRLITDTGPDNVEPDPRRVALVSADGTRRHARTEESGSWSYIFDDVGPGTFRVEVDDPRFQSWSKDDVSAGMHLRTLIWPTSSVDLDVRSASGLPLETFEVLLTVERPGSFPWRARRKGETDADGRARIDRLHPGDYVLTIRSETGSARVAVEDLLPGETRPLDVVLASKRAVRGRVTHTDGSEAGNVLVRLVEPAPVDDSPDAFVVGPGSMASSMERVRREQARTTTDGAGAFELPVEGDGTWIVIVGGSSSPMGGLIGPMAESGPFETKAAPQDLALQVARGGHITGRIRFPEGLDPEGRVVYFFREEEAPFHRVPKARTRSLGRFELGPVAAGRGRLFVHDPNSSTLHGGVQYSAAFLDEVEVVDGETTTIDVDAPADDPASLIIQLESPERTSAGAIVHLERHGREVPGARSSGEGPSFGPFVVEAGRYDVWICGDDWAAVRPGLSLAPGEERSEPIEVDLKPRNVRFVVNGEAVANASIQLHGAPFRIKTDRKGRSPLRLGAGTYRVSWGLSASEAFFAEFAWPLGAEDDEIELRGFGE